MIVTVGTVVKAHGLRGEVVVDVRTDTPDERFAAGSDLLATSARQRPGATTPSALTVASTRWHQGRLLVRFEGVPDRTAAETLRGIQLRVEIDDDERPAQADEYFDHELVGLGVVTVDGDDVGEVREIMHAPAQDLLVISRPGGADALVPLVAALVPEIDLDARRIVIDPPSGLLQLGDPGG